MKQVIESQRSGKVNVVENPLPQYGPNEVLVRNVVSLISPGTERLMIEMGKKSLAGKALARPDLVSLAYRKAKREGFLRVFRESLSRLDEPLPLGYSSAGEVIAVGPGVVGISVGDAVACAGHGYASHAEVIAVPQEFCVKLPRTGTGQTIPYEEAAFVMLGGIALHGIRCADLAFGERVAVIGLGLLGLLTVQLARSYGCHVYGTDIEPEKVQLAKKLGCNTALVLGKADVESALLDLTEGQGVDSVIVTAAAKNNSPILLAERIARQRGKIVLVGVADISLTRKAFWDKELTFTVSKASGPSAGIAGAREALPFELVRWTEKRNLEEFIRLVANGSVRVGDLITHRLPIDHAVDAYEMILKGRERYIGVLITYPQDVSQETTVRVGTRVESRTRPSTDEGPRQNIGIIGSGMFTKNVLLPTAKKVKGLRFVGIAAEHGVSSRHAAEKFGFEYATSDASAILNDGSIGSVLITTRHNLHARFVNDALRAGKHVFVEKPLCLTHQELRDLEETFKTSWGGLMFMVGFNRRYSLLSQELKKAFEKRNSPLICHFRVNAGFIPAEHWTQDPDVGGGRIIGEVCHFVDYLQFITDSDPVKVFAQSIGGTTGRFLQDDNVLLSLQFADGSLGSITYTSQGTKMFSRERLEVFCGESVAVLDDFRALQIISAANRRKKRLWSQDMGYRKELSYFMSASPEGSAERFRQAALTTLATFAAFESLRTGGPVHITGSGELR
jgi:predicted dehydrogenase/threonine dehydrogenase-like Zn-dependent dehydrogenase